MPRYLDFSIEKKKKKFFVIQFFSLKKRTPLMEISVLLILELTTIKLFFDTISVQHSDLIVQSTL
jgi:hypothetical protein